MSNLALVALALGAVLVLAGAAMAAAPGTARRLLAAFPRDIWGGRILAAAGLAWSAWLVYQMPFGGFDVYKPALYGIAPGIFVLAVLFLDELLAARALGGILLLVPDVMLNAAFGHPSPLRLVIVALAYAMIVLGLFLIISPFRFRRAVRPAIEAGDPRCRAVGIGGAVAGVALCLLGVIAY